MDGEIVASVKRLSDDEIVAQLRALAASERDATAQLVAHLGELETRGLHLKAGYGSLFSYCREALALSEHESYNRIEVARAARRFPAVLALLADGSVNLTTARLLAPHLTPDNHRAVLESARGKKKIEVEEIVARIAPLAEVPSWIRRLPAPRAAPHPAPVPPAVDGDCAPILATPPPALRFPASPSASTTPLAPDRYKLQVTIGASTVEKIRLAKDMLGHAVPSGDDAAILDRALTALLVDLAKAKFAATDRPRPSPGTGPDSRHVPADVRRAVWVRDLGRCAFVGLGRRCDERRFLEFHHVKPYAVGGAPTVANIQLRCKRHNNYEASVYFARDDRGWSGGVGARPETSAPRPAAPADRKGASGSPAERAGPRGS